MRPRCSIDAASRPSSIDPAGTRSRANRMTRRSPTGTVATTSEPTAAAANAGAARCETLRVKRIAEPVLDAQRELRVEEADDDPQIRPQGAGVQRGREVDQVVARRRDDRPARAEAELLEDLGVAGVPDEDRDPGGAGRRDEPAARR